MRCDANLKCCINTVPIIIIIMDKMLITLKANNFLFSTQARTVAGGTSSTYSNRPVIQHLDKEVGLAVLGHNNSTLRC